MRVTIISHPLVQHKISILRDRTTPSPVFRSLANELSGILAYEATRDLITEQVMIDTPVESAEGSRLAAPAPLVVPILRAGLGMLDGVLGMMPTAEVGFLGIKRNEETLQPFTYANRLPDDLRKRQVLIIDPMLATGGTLMDSIDYIFQRGATDVTCICLIGAPEGLENLEAHQKTNWPMKSVHVVLGALDRQLNEVGYIVPGLGDAGDRLYGLVD